MTADSANPHGRSDADLIAAVRAGRIEDYGTLYERHVAAATRLARQLVSTAADADDIVSEAFGKVLDVLRDGRGPDSAFRAYLLTAVRNTAYGHARSQRRTQPTDDVEAAGGAEALATAFADPALAEFERSLVARAFFSLPERWQAVLWHTVVEQQGPSEVAPLFGISPGALSALAFRAREGLRQQYLAAHLGEVSGRRCRATATKLGAWTRDGLSRRERAQVEQHLDGCARCRALAGELADLNGTLRGVVAFLILGGSTFGYLAASSATAPAAAAATTAAGASAAGGASPADGASRQFLGVAVSGVAMATAVAMALTAGGVPPAPVADRDRGTDTARAPEAHVPEQGATPPEATTPPPPLPSLPAPHPDADSYRPPSSSKPIPPPPLAPPSSPEPEPEPSEPDPTPEPPQPEPSPSVTASVPDEGVALDADGGPAVLDVTLRNTGDAPTDDASVELALPDGVAVVAADDPGARTEARSRTGGSSALPGAIGPATRPPATPREELERVECPAGEGTVSCAVEGGLGSGESVRLRFRLVASRDARSGEISGVATVNGAEPTSFTVPITVNPDRAKLAISRVGHNMLVTVTNAGVRAADVSVAVDAPAWGVSSRLHCTPGPASFPDVDTPLTCESSRPVAAGQRARVLVHAHPESDSGEVRVTATVGEATTTETVRLRPLLPHHSEDSGASEYSVDRPEGGGGGDPEDNPDNRDSGDSDGGTDETPGPGTPADEIPDAGTTDAETGGAGHGAVGGLSVDDHPATDRAADRGPGDGPAERSGGVDARSDADPVVTSSAERTKLSPLSALWRGLTGRGIGRRRPAPPAA